MIFSANSARRQYLLAAALVALYLLQILFAASHQAQTIDEGFHLTAGYRYWQCGDFGFNSEHPPIVKLVAAAPLWLAHTPAPPGACGKEPTTKVYGYGTAAHWFTQPDLNPDQTLFRARCAVSVFSLLLAITCFFFARQLFGGTAALFALTLLVFEPTLLAHGALITTDTAVTAFICAAVFAFYCYAQQPTPTRLFIAGLVAGLTLAVKHSGVLIIPILVVLAVFEAARNTHKDRAKNWLRHAAALALILVIAVAVLWMSYGLRFASRPGGAAMTTSITDFISIAQAAGNHGFLLAHVIPQLVRWHILPQAYLYGFVDVLNVSNPGFPPFILGRLYPHGRWFYFPITFFIKSTLGFLGLFVLALFAVPWRRLNLGRQLFYVTAPATVLMCIAMTSGLNIGYRHVLPMVPFLCVLLGAAAAVLIRKSRRYRILVAALLFLHIASSVHAFPDYIPYSNEAWGGPSKTYRYLTDSNVDWGQAIKEAGHYIAANDIQDCWAAYDGVVPAERYGVICRPLPPNATGSTTLVPPLTASGTFILSDLSVSGIEWERPELNPYREFLKTKPKAVIGGAMLVYEGTFDLTGAAAVEHIGAARGLVDQKQYEQAKREAEQGIALMPESVGAHFALGNALAGLNQPEAARKELETALDLATRHKEWYSSQLPDIRHALAELSKPAAAS